LFPAALLAALVTLLSSGARGTDIDTATQAYLAGDYPRAISLFESLAEKGDTLAQYSMANMYASGQGVKEDQRTAVRWLRRAAQGGYRRAAIDLGNRYASGLGVKRDVQEAAKWLEMAGNLSPGEDEQDTESDCD
jgi:TPR repeat protein